MRKKISDYLPSKEKVETVNVQGQVSKDLVEQVKKIMKKRNVTWNELLDACLRHYSDESSDKLK